MQAPPRIPPTPTLALLLAVLGCNSLPDRGCDDATLSVGQPTVYRRERSLVERFEDLEWLRLQRSPDKEKEYEQAFQGSSRTATAEAFGVALEAALLTALSPDKDGSAPSAPTPPAVGSPAAAPAPGVPATQPNDTAPPATPADPKSTDPKSTAAPSALALLSELDEAALAKALAELNAEKPTLLPRDKLANRIAFRDGVSEAIRRRSLDDVHDLEGMALYEVQFDLSIAPGEDSGQAYAVMFEVVPNSCAIADPNAKARVAQALQAHAAAEIEETLARWDADALLVKDGGAVEEALLYGLVAARHEAMEQVLDVLTRVQPAAATEELAEWRSSLAGLNGSESKSLAAARDGLFVGGKLRDALAKLACATTAADQALDAMAASTDVSRVKHANVFLDKQEGRVNGRQNESAGPRALTPSRPGEGVSYQDAGEEASFDAILDEVRENRTLSVAQASSLKALLRVPTRENTQAYARRALGFEIARRVADASAGLLSTDCSLVANGLDGKTLLPLYLRDCSKDHCTDLGMPSQPHVVAVAPTEVAEQVSTSAFSDLSRAFSVALDGTFRGSITEANSAYQDISRELRRYELIRRNSLLVGFVGPSVSKSRGTRGPNTFGWIVAPRLETSTSKTAELRYRHVAAHHTVTATLLAPALLSELKFNTRVYRIANDGTWVESSGMPQPVPREISTDNSARSIFLRLPTSPAATAQSLLERSDLNASAPRVLFAGPGARGGQVDQDPRWRLQAGQDKQSIVLLGSNLWRNPQVYVGGQRASRVQILADLGGLWAEFDGVQAPAGHDGKPVRVDLIVSTSRGTDRLFGGVEIVPSKEAATPPAPQFGPAVQVVNPVVSEVDKKFIAAFHLDLLVTPKLAKSWSELRLLARPKNAAGWPYDIRLEPHQVEFSAEKNSDALRLRDVRLTRDKAWNDSHEVLEVMLHVRDTHDGDLRPLGAVPLEVVLLKLPILCKTVTVEVEFNEAEKAWVLAANQALKITAVQPLPAQHADALHPALKGGAKVSTTVVIGELSKPAILSSPVGEFGNSWLLELPKGTKVSGQPKEGQPQKAEFVVAFDRLRWSVPVEYGPSTK